MSKLEMSGLSSDPRVGSMSRNPSKIGDEVYRGPENSINEEDEPNRVDLNKSYFGPPKEPYLIGVSRKIKEDLSFVEYTDLVAWIAKNYPSDLSDTSMTVDQKAAAMMGIIEYGAKLGLQWMESLGLVYLREGRIAIKGDFAMSLILRSGTLRDYAKTEIGSIEGGDYKVTLSGSRLIDGGSISFGISFSIADAKRIGLYHPTRSFGNDDFWMLYPERMVYYRALGFMARDYFSDLLYGAYLLEELIGQGNMKVINESAKQEKTNGKETANVVARAKKEPTPKESPQEAPSKPVDNLDNEDIESSTESDAPDAPDASVDAESRFEQEKGETQDVGPLPKHIMEQVEALTASKGYILNLDTVNDMVKRIFQIAPHLSMAIDQFPGRRTKQRIEKIIDAFIEDPRQIPAYMMSEFSIVGFSYNLDVDILSKRHDVESQEEKADDEPWDGAEKKDDIEGLSEETESEDKVTLTPIDRVSSIIPNKNEESGMRDLDDVRDMYDTLASLHPALMDVMDQIYNDDSSPEKDQFDDFEDFLLCADTEMLAATAVKALYDLEVDMTTIGNKS